MKGIIKILIYSSVTEINHINVILFAIIISFAWGASSHVSLIKLLQISHKWVFMAYLLAGAFAPYLKAHRGFFV